ncbi:MAG: hypothetical protein ACN6O3_18170 [Comamonas sp.]
MKRLPSLALAALCLCTSASVLAARDFTPQAGTWVVSSELDGKPGRGLAIDVQGNTLFMQVFDYEKNGDATFHTALGQMDGNTVTTPLVRYRGGRSFGGEARDAVEDGSPGAVTVSFANGLHGTVQFPGEEPVAMERFIAMSPQFVTDELSPRKTGRRLKAVGLDEAGQAAIAWDAMLSPGQLGLSRITGKYSSQRLDCTELPQLEAYTCEGQAPEDGSAWVASAQLRVVGADVQGQIEVHDGATLRRYVLMGMAIYAGGVGIPECLNYQQIYVQTGPSGCKQPPLITPSSGTWIVADELTGKPGRGLAIDVQNGLAIVQVFNYLADGRPSFHMGSGEYAGVATTMELIRYADGRYFGGPQRTAQAVEPTGELQLQFAVSDQQRLVAQRVAGMVQLPGELSQRMQRLALEPDTTSHQGLLGQWMLAFEGPDQTKPWRETRFVTLSRELGDAAASEDGSVQCRRQPQEGFWPQPAVCEWRREDRAEVWKSGFVQQTNNRSASTMQIRDRHGNLLGLGNIPLPQQP